MPRDFDGTDDVLTLGSDASVDDFATKSIALWLLRDTTAFSEIVAKMIDTNTWGIFIRGPGGGNRLGFGHAFSGGNAAWDIGAISTATRTHIAIVYDNGSTANDPTFYLNGVSQALNLNPTPSGTANADAAHNLCVGETGTGTSDFDGELSHLIYANELFSAADVNRARWWGRAKGGLAVYHPLVTDKLANEGTATADATATGTTVGNDLVTPVVRPGSAMLGCGVGW
jgi:hypothetical protein